MGWISSRFKASLGCVVMLGCGEAKPLGPTSPSSPKAPTAPMAAAPAADLESADKLPFPKPNAAGEPRSPLEPLALSVQQATHGPQAPAETVTSRDVWLRSHGSKTDLEGKVPEALCDETSIGPASELAISCSEIEHVDQGPSLYRVLERRRVYVVRKGAPVVVLDVIDRVMPLDKLSEDMSNILDLSVRFEPSGTTVHVEDAANGGEAACTRARNALTRATKTDPKDAWSRFDRTLVDRACRGVGRYEWRGNRFQR